MASDSTADSIVLLATYPDSIAAHLAKSKLEAEEIPCFLSNESRPYGPISGGVRLHVRRADLAQAQEALQQVSMHALAADTAPDSDAPGARRCPRCHHAEVFCRQSQPADSLFTKLRFWLLASEKPQCHCFHCGYDFEGE